MWCGVKWWDEKLDLVFCLSEDGRTFLSQIDMLSYILRHVLTHNRNTGQRNV